MQILPFINNIDHLVGMIILFTLHQSRKIRCRVDSGTVRLSHYAGRKLLFVARLSDINNQSALALMRHTALFHVFKHVGYIRICVALTKPQFKAHAEICIVFLEVFP